jgi:beta-glucanase (GH16 family)
MSVPVYKFQDEFDGPAGSAPNPVNWTYDIGGWGWGNNELETYTSSRANSYLDGNGNLVIKAVRGRKGQYTSARLKTQGIFSASSGAFEARIKIPNHAGLWPASWMLGADIDSAGWPQCGEVDVMEWFGNNSWAAASTVHTAGYDGSDFYIDNQIPGGIDSNWHVWRAVVTSTGITFFKDGTEFASIAQSLMPNWVFGQTPLFIVLNLAVGGDGGGSIPLSTVFPATMLVDYVRVW